METDISMWWIVIGGIVSSIATFFTTVLLGYMLFRNMGNLHPQDRMTPREIVGRIIMILIATSFGLIASFPLWITEAYMWVYMVAWVIGFFGGVGSMVQRARKAWEEA